MGPASSRQVRVRAPGAATVDVLVQRRLDGAGVTAPSRTTATRDADADGWWTASFDAADGDLYWLSVDGGAPVFDPHCWDLDVTPHGPRSVVRRPWEPRPQGAPLADPPVVYELHPKGFPGGGLDGSRGGYLACIEHLDHVVAVGANVIELMPVHPFDARTNYWGYMPLVWGAVHRGYAQDPSRAAEELATMIAAAHDRGLHVWIDVVFNHTGEDEPALGGQGLRALDPSVYRRHADGTPTNDSGCGNDIDPADPWVRDLVLEGLGRYADLGVDGFRFDLASLLTRDRGGLVTRITDWAIERGVQLVAEPWDMGGYQLGHGWPWPSWLQWNDRFRDQVRGFLRGEPGLARAVRQRVQGSPDLFGPDGAVRSLNFITAHDGLTMHDLTIMNHDRHHAWDCGPSLRLQQLKNYFALLLLSAGTPMWVMGDEFARTQQGNDNPYDIDGPVSWVDWSRRDDWAALTDFVRALTALRRRHSLARFTFHGVGPEPDLGWDSHSLAWCAGDLYVMVNAWWEPLTFEVQQPGTWQLSLATAGTKRKGKGWTLPPRTVVILER
ncbi:MAG: alpha-amylase family glycosyl hydrolase [Ilumatobacteraceae bacterium]